MLTGIKSGKNSAFAALAKWLMESKKTYGEADHPDVDELYNEIPKNIIPYLASDIFLTPIVKAEHGSSSGVRGAAHLW